MLLDRHGTIKLQCKQICSHPFTEWITIKSFIRTVWRCQRCKQKQKMEGETIQEKREKQRSTKLNREN